MTDTDRIAEIEQRAGKATAGPWEFEMGGADEARFFAVPCGGTILSFSTYGTEAMEGPDPDYDFIAHAREDVPWLCERVRSLEAALANEWEECAKMPSPDTLVKNAAGYECAAMFYYGMPEGVSATDIARENGFELCFVMADDVLQDEDPRMVAYEQGSNGWAFDWHPETPTHRGGGWKWAGSGDTEDGPCAWFLRPIDRARAALKGE